MLQRRCHSLLAQTQSRSRLAHSFKLDPISVLNQPKPIKSEAETPTSPLCQRAEQRLDALCMYRTRTNQTPSRATWESSSANSTNFARSCHTLDIMHRGEMFSSLPTRIGRPSPSALLRCYHSRSVHTFLLKVRSLPSICYSLAFCVNIFGLLSLLSGAGLRT